MPNEILDNFRQKYPQYKDIPDDVLAQGIVKQYPIYEDKLKDVLGKKSIPLAAGATQIASEKKIPFTQTGRGLLAQQVYGGIGTPGELRYAREKAVSSIPNTLAAVGSMAGPVGTFAGAAGGKGLEIGARSLYDPEYQSKHAGFGGAARSIGEMGLEGVVNVALEKVGGVIAKTLGKFGSKYLARWMQPESIAARETAKTAEKPFYDILSAGQKLGPKITKERIIDENLTTALQKSYNALSKEVPIGGAAEKAVDAIDVGRKTLHQVFSGEFEMLNRSIMDVAENQPGIARAGVDTRKMGLEIRGDPNRILKDFEESFRPGELKAYAITPGVTRPGGFSARVIDDIVNMGQRSRETGVPIDIEGLQHFRATLLAEARESGKKIDIEIANRASKAVGDEMYNIASKVDERIRQRGGVAQFGKQMSELNKAYGEAVDLFDHEYINGLARKDPEKLVNSVMGNNETHAKLIKQVLTDSKWSTPETKAAYEGFQRSYASRLTGKNMTELVKNLEKSQDAASAVFGGTKWESTYKRMNQLSDAWKILSQEEQTRLDAMITESARTGSSRLLIRPIQIIKRGMEAVMVGIFEHKKSFDLFMQAVKEPQKLGSSMFRIEKAVEIAIRANLGDQKQTQ